VFFAIVKGPGISITEAQLLDIPASGGCGDGDNAKPKAKSKSGKK
jgi:hypothetical protein